jgi:hypothetical protein
MLSTHVAAVVLVLLHGAAGALPHPPRASGRSAPRVLFAQPLTSRRDVLIGAAATLGAAVALLPAPRPASAASDGLVWRPLEQALAPSLRVGSGETYPPRFVAYLSRFLLKFDRLSRSWWESKASEVPKQFDQERVSELRLEHYAEFARSVELGLEAEYAGAQGVTQLVDLLRRQFTTQPERRQMAILLTLLPRRTQPVEDITKLLGETDNAQVRTIKVSDGGAGYDARNPPQVRITSPAASVAGGTAGVAAELRAVVVDGRVSSIEIRNQGKGYSYAQTLELIIAPPPPPLPKPVPREVLAPPLASDANASDVNASVALAEAVEVVVEPPRQAIASATLRPRDAFLRGPGSTWSGWLAKSATSVELLTLLPSDTPIAYDGARKCYQIQLAMVGGRSPAGADGGAPVAVAPLSPADIAVEAAREAAPSSGELLSTRRAYEVLDPIFGPIGRSPVEKQASLDASQFARLAFSGALCAALGHAILTPLEVVKTRVQADSTAFDGLGFFGAAKRIVRLEADAAAARAAASAPPADARVAEAADATPRGVGGAAADVAVDAPPILSAGLPALFRGIDASAFGHFVSGGISFGVTELCRRVFASALGPERMLLLPSPLTVVGASVVGICFATVGGAPFEATRVKMVSSARLAAARAARHAAARTPLRTAAAVPSDSAVRTTSTRPPAGLGRRRVRAQRGRWALAPRERGGRLVVLRPKISHAALEGRALRDGQIRLL